MTNEQSHWLIQTKLFPPTQSIRRIEREGQEINIAKYSKYKLCIVHAFAGYGKTTFLKDWFETNQKNSISSVWISLDEEDKNISSLFSYLVEGIKKIDIPCESLQQLAEQSNQDMPIRVLASALISVFCQQKQPIAIFLDDYQRAACENTDEFLQTVIAYAPENIKFIISSRIYPTFSVENFRANGNLIDIQTNTLRFNKKELACLFENRLSSSDIQLIWERTEGWPIACQMANYLLKQNSLSTSDIQNFTGTNRELSNYITEQVFQTLTPIEQLFLMTTSVVERFTGDLADSLHDEYDSWKVMEQLERKKLFLVPLKGNDGWYRYHQLFGQYLYNKLQNIFKKEISGIHRKAANWLFENNYIPEAVNQAILGKDPELAARELDTAGGWRLTFKGKLDFMQRTLKRLPNEIINSYPRLYLNKIIILIRSGKIVVARDIAQKFRNNSNDFSCWNKIPLPDLIKMEWIVVTDLLMGSYADISATDKRLTDLKKLKKDIETDDSLLIGIVDGCLFHQYWERGDINHAIEVQDERALAITQEKPISIYWSVYNYINISILDVEQCKLESASRALTEGLVLVEKYPELDFNLHSAISVFLAELSYLRNDISYAKTLLTPALLHLEQYDASFKHYAPAFVTMVAIARITADRKAVLNIIDRGYHVANTRQLPRLKTLCDIQLIKYLLLAGEIEDARAKSDELKLELVAHTFPNSGDLSVYLPELANLTLARLYLSEHAYDEAIEALKGLEQKMCSQQRKRILVELYLLQARIFFESKDSNNALKFINDAIQVSLHEDYKRVFIDEGEGGLDMFNLAIEDHNLGKVNHYYIQFLDDIIKTINSESRKISSRSDGLELTDMEYKVVLEVSKGLSNKHIARLYDVSEDFVKYQLRKTFKKLGITSRDEAAKIIHENTNK